MPTLHWIGKDKVVGHHREVPYKVLNHQYGFTAEKGEQGEATDSGNKIIYGDNLEALKSLLPEYEGKIKCIYIDPPYNTGNEGWVYNDNVNHPKIKKWLGEVVGKDGEDLTRHDKWLCMMYPRLQLLRKLLANDGAIFISIDDNEQASLKLMCDEIFGGRNFVCQFVWEKNFAPKNDNKYISKSHEQIFLYAKNKNDFKRNLLPRTEKHNKGYSNPDNDKRGVWSSGTMLATSFSDNYVYPILRPNGTKVYPPDGRCWRYSKDRLEQLLQDNRIWFGKEGGNTPRIKRFLFEVQDGVVPMSLLFYKEVGSGQDGTNEVKGIFEKHIFDFPKPTKLLKHFLKIATQPNDLILDSFAGSGTTAHAVLNLNQQDGGNRKFILIEMEDYAGDITAERVKRVARGYGKDNKAIAGTGGAFDFYKLGERLFDQYGFLNEAVSIAKIRAYIWFSETRVPFVEPKAERYFLGTKEGTVYYFFYEKDDTTTLDYESLSLIKTKGEMYIIYADNCLLPKDFMMKHRIFFKKIPRDIARF